MGARPEQVLAQPWRSSDPWESDWVCRECGAEYYDAVRRPICEICLKPRILDDDEQRRFEASQRTGKLLCRGVIMAEALPEKIGKEMDSWDQCIREWQKGRTQKLKVNGQTKYLLLAFPDTGDDGDWYLGIAEHIITETLPAFCKIPNKVFTFREKKSLNEITEEIMSQEFGIALESQEE